MGGDSYSFKRGRPRELDPVTEKNTQKCMFVFVTKRNQNPDDQKCDRRKEVRVRKSESDFAVVLERTQRSNGRVGCLEP